MSEPRIVVGSAMVRKLMYLVLAGTLCSCSWAFMSKPPDAPPPVGMYVSCTDSSAAPVIDTVAAALFGLSTIILVGLAADDNLGDGDGLALAAGIYGSVTLAYGLSASSGFSNATKCRQMRQMAFPVMPPGYYPPAPFYPQPQQPPPPQPYPQPPSPGPVPQPIPQPPPPAPTP